MELHGRWFGTPPGLVSTLRRINNTSVALFVRPLSPPTCRAEDKCCELYVDVCVAVFSRLLWYAAVRETLHSAESAVPHQPQLAEAPTLLTTYCSNKKPCIGTVIHSEAMPHSKPATLDEWCGVPLPIDDWEPTSTEAPAATPRRCRRQATLRCRHDGQ